MSVTLGQGEVVGAALVKVVLGAEVLVAALVEVVPGAEVLVGMVPGKALYRSAGSGVVAFKDLFKSV